ncbi:hypothetical protein M5D96_014166, partial [Drosophila gunungcola]
RTIQSRTISLCFRSYRRFDKQYHCSLPHFFLGTCTLKLVYPLFSGIITNFIFARIAVVTTGQTVGSFSVLISSTIMRCVCSVCK